MPFVSHVFCCLSLFCGKAVQNGLDWTLYIVLYEQGLWTNYSLIYESDALSCRCAEGLKNRALRLIIHSTDAMLRASRPVSVARTLHALSSAGGKTPSKPSFLLQAGATNVFLIELCPRGNNIWSALVESYCLHDRANKRQSLSLTEPSKCHMTPA